LGVSIFVYAGIAELLTNKSLFQNSVSFGKGFRKIDLKVGFSVKSKAAFPKNANLRFESFGKASILLFLNGFY